MSYLTDLSIWVWHNWLSLLLLCIIGWLLALRMVENGVWPPWVMGAFGRHVVAQRVQRLLRYKEELAAEAKTLGVELRPTLLPSDYEDVKSDLLVVGYRVEFFSLLRALRNEHQTTRTQNREYLEGLRREATDLHEVTRAQVIEYQEEFRRISGALHEETRAQTRGYMDEFKACVRETVDEMHAQTLAQMSELAGGLAQQLEAIQRRLDEEPK